MFFSQQAPHVSSFTDFTFKTNISSISAGILNAATVRIKSNVICQNQEFW